MKRHIVTALVMSALLAGVAVPAFAGNVANGKTVAGRGMFFTTNSTTWLDGLTADFSTVTDGNFFEVAHQWDQGTVWWQEDMDSEQNYLKVFLVGSKVCPTCPKQTVMYKVKSITVQVDNNDDYEVSWDDKRPEYAATNPQKVTIPAVEGWGMRCAKLNVDAVTDAFTIKAIGGDNLYSISEFQADGCVAPKKLYMP